MGLGKYGMNPIFQFATEERKIYRFYMIKKSSVLIFALSVLINFVTAEDPLESSKPIEIQGINKLYNKIVGTTWIHHYKNGKFPFTFGTNGVIENHKTWQVTPWRVVSSSEVILGKKDGRGKMVFTFDKNIENFVNLDWDGTPATGKVLKSDANQNVSSAHGFKFIFTDKIPNDVRPIKGDGMSKIHVLNRTKNYVGLGFINSDGNLACGYSDGSKGQTAFYVGPESRTRTESPYTVSNGSCFVLFTLQGKIIGYGIPNEQGEYEVVLE
jgi:hypothetical protein